MKPSSAKAKGRRLQDHIRTRILETFPELGEPDVKTAVMGESGMDIHLSTAARERFPFQVEAKNQERLNIWAALDQAQEHGEGEGLIPLVVFKRNRSDVYAALRLDDLLKLLRRCGCPCHTKDDRPCMECCE